MTEAEAYECAETLESRYPEIDVRSAFSAVADSYLAGAPLKYGVHLPAEFVIDALCLIRHAAGQVVSEPEAPKIVLSPVAAVMMEDRPAVEVASERKGCLGFLKKG
jgi:hypothetical protein